jgi:6-phospho-beta-glucosidase
LPTENHDEIIIKGKSMKVTVIGGGSTYTPELINGFLERWDRFPLSELWLMDINPERLEIVGGFAKRMAASQGAPFEVFLTTDQRAAIKDASYVITQFRVGMMQARREDEYLGRRHGLVGQETTGVGGMAKALRTIPVILKIAQDMRQLAPKALLINFTNPSGLITQALSLHAPDVSSVGLCNIPITTKMEILEDLQKETGQRIAPERAELITLGLNHLSWHRGFMLDGENIWQTILEKYVKEQAIAAEPEFDPNIIETLQMIPNHYLNYYYYTEKELAEQQQWPPSRAEEVIEIEKGLLKQYANPQLIALPDELMERGGAYYSTAATQLINAHYNDTGETHVVSVRQAGAVKEWPADWVLEMPCRVDKSGIHPLPAEPLPSVCFGLLAQVKSYELLTVQAAVSGNRRVAIQALLAHPLGPSADHIPDVLDDMIETNRSFLPPYWQK